MHQGLMCEILTGFQIASYSSVSTLQRSALCCTNLGRVVLSRFASTRSYGNFLFFYYFLTAKQTHAKNSKSDNLSDIHQMHTTTESNVPP